MVMIYLYAPLAWILSPLNAWTSRFLPEESKSHSTKLDPTKAPKLVSPVANGKFRPLLGNLKCRHSFRELELPSVPESPSPDSSGASSAPKPQSHGGA